MYNICTHLVHYRNKRLAYQFKLNEWVHFFLFIKFARTLSFTPVPTNPFCTNVREVI